jgi:excisionase family DNA binding protein
VNETLPLSKSKWFSIPQAAAYLDVGEPTIYRWMREGKITYRKVGDSTRFWQEDLESVMEVFHSDKDVDKARLICTVCHLGELVSGKVRSTGLCFFQPDKTRFWTFRDSTVEIEARMCVRCGAVNLFGNTRKLGAIKPQKKNPAAVVDK